MRTDSHTLYHAAGIEGGYVIWREDIRAITSLISSLQETEEELKEGVDLMEKEIETRSRRIQVDEQNRLYRLTVQQTQPQLARIKELLGCPRESDRKAIRQQLTEICVLGIFIKRRSHLVLLSEGQQMTAVIELARCFAESLRSLEEYGVECQLAILSSGEMQITDMIELYDRFQAKIEAELFSLQMISVRLIEIEDRFQLHLSWTAHRNQDDDKDLDSLNENETARSQKRGEQQFVWVVTKGSA